ncbi:hypothetical protein AFL01nite_12180 [Aeromicrobium flavum]|uniref:Uncharacterized protein n=1 Tax=Aeromicrobium flavum TaxID=416568 RepID=A0A512HTW0_9ACTN|nr:hypothetical protein AFL01nite_12180 [Aeromicrobium flavum]
MTPDGRTYGPLADDLKAAVPYLVSVHGDHGGFGYTESDLVFAEPPADLGPDDPGPSEYVENSPKTVPRLRRGWQDAD